MRPSGRAPDQLRPVEILPGFARHAEGSCLIRMGGTEVLCAASVEGRVPSFLRGKGLGWVTAEYGMLPRSTHTRGDREAARGRQGGRTHEIQRLIGRSLRAVIDRAALGEMQVTLDCDVLNADGGTRCAAITGAWVALALACRRLVDGRVLARSPLTGQVAAVSCGLVGAEGETRAVLDLDYAEDSEAEADANFVMSDAGGLVEVQATAEKAPFSAQAQGRNPPPADPARARPSGKGSPSATETGATSTSTRAARTAQGRSRVASSAGSSPSSTKAHQPTTTAAESAMPTLRTRSANRLPRPENTSIPVSTKAKALVRSFR